MNESMELTPAEEKILKIIGEMNLAKKTDIERALLNNGMNGADDIGTVIDAATEGLMRKKLVTKIHPIGFACYIITKQGTSALGGLNK